MLSLQIPFQPIDFRCISEHSITKEPISKTLMMNAVRPSIHLHQSSLIGDHVERKSCLQTGSALQITAAYAHPKSSNIHLLQSLSNVIRHNSIPQTNRPIHIPIVAGNAIAPMMFTKEDISMKWHEINRSPDWSRLIDPLQPWLREEMVKYGEFAQATYDAFNFDSSSKNCGNCHYPPRQFFDKLGLTRHGYKVSKYIYAMAHVDLPRWLERSHLMDAWSRNSNWMGYVAVSDDDESQRIGRRDVVVSWRGTIAPLEWYEDLQRKLELIGDGDVRVEHGFRSIYTSKCDSTRYNKSSASEQVIQEVTKLVNFFKQRGEEVGLTITGHSLGGALALLNAYDAASVLPGLPISVISFGAPRVGNIAFREKLHQMQVKTLRVVIKQDVVPQMPGIVFNESLAGLEEITGPLDWVYTHVGSELQLDVHASPYLKHGFNVIGAHSLETYLHLVDGFYSKESGFREDAHRDVALVNKACGMLLNELGIPECWHQQANMRHVCNNHRTRVQPKTQRRYALA